MGSDKNLTEIIPFRVSSATEAELKAIAAAKDMSPSALLRELVESYLMGYRMVEVEVEHERVPA